jgi:hypothetical protein
MPAMFADAGVKAYVVEQGFSHAEIAYAVAFFLNDVRKS